MTAGFWPIADPYRQHEGEGPGASRSPLERGDGSRYGEAFAADGSFTNLFGMVM